MLALVILKIQDGTVDVTFFGVIFFILLAVALSPLVRIGSA